MRVGDHLHRVRVYQEKAGLKKGDAVFLTPDQDSAIVVPKQSGGLTDPLVEPTASGS